jgi:F-type H+-transporting ATPase subunit b
MLRMKLKLKKRVNNVENMRNVGVFMCMALCLWGTSALAAGGGHSGNLHINWWEWDDHAPPLGWFIVDFGLFVALLIYLIKKPLRNVFVKRHTTIKESIEQNQIAHGKAKAYHDEYRSKIDRIQQEVESLLQGAQADGISDRDSTVDAAQSYATRVSDEADSTIGQELSASRRRLHAQFSGDVLDVAGQMLRDQVSHEDQQRLIEDAIVALEKNPSTKAPANSAMEEASP